jgi:hypothetical protein
MYVCYFEQGDPLICAGRSYTEVLGPIGTFFRYIPLTNVNHGTGQQDHARKLSIRPSREVRV